MTDFYTVLCNALDRVGATQVDERDRVYAHVRDVMVRKLRNYRPPLPEAEIANRINTFDAAIERIEGEIADAAAPHLPPPDDYEEPPPAPSPPRYGNGGWAERDVGTDAAWEEEAAAPQPMWGSPAIDMAWDESSEQWRDPSRSRPIAARAGADRRWQEADRYAEPDPEERYEEAEPRPRRSPRSRPQRAEAPPQPAEPAAYDEPAVYDEPETYDEDIEPEERRGFFARFLGRFRRERDDEFAAPPTRARGRRAPAPAETSRRTRRGGDPIDSLARELGNGGAPDRVEPLLLGAPAPVAPAAPPAALGHETRLYLPSPDQLAEEKPRRSRGNRPSRGRQKRAESRPPPLPEPEPQAFYDDEVDESDRAGERADRAARTRRVLRYSLLAFAALVIAWAAYVFIPILFPAGPATATGEVAATPTPASQPAVEAGERIFLFRGEDPTVFASGSDNPISFFSADGGGYVRIGSTITSGGARIVVGPGVAGRIAGHDIRVAMEVRGTPEQPAVTTRLGYQSGVAISEWRILRVPTEYGIVTATWSVPEGGGSRDDYILVEPGVPGDGNSIDIRNVWIEVIQ